MSTLKTIQATASITDPQQRIIAASATVGEVLDHTKENKQQYCWLCKMKKLVRPTVGDTGMCYYHAMNAAFLGL